jgi:hypothetical protein
MKKINVINSDFFEGESLEKDCEVVGTISETKCVVKLSSDNSILCIVELTDGRWVIADNLETDDDGNCVYCGGKCFEGEMCDEQQAGGFNNE